MNISLQNVDKVSALLTLKLEKADYQARVEKTLKTYRQKANIPGFRPGMVPMSLIKKQFGKSVLVEEVDKMMQEKVNEYIRDNKVNMLGMPLPNEEKMKPIDFDTQEDFEFVFDIALAPEFTAEISAADTVDYYTIEVSDELIEQQVKMYTQRAAKYDKVEQYEDKDMIKGLLAELDENGNTKEGGIQVEGAVMMPAYMKNDEQKAIFNGAKVNDVLVFNPAVAFDNNEAELSSLLKIKKEEVAGVKGNFSFQVEEITRMVPAELNQELFDNVFGEGTVSSEEEFRAKIKEEIAARFVADSDYKFLIDVRKVLMDKVGKLEFPDALLKRIMLLNNEEKGEEYVSVNIKIYRWGFANSISMPDFGTGIISSRKAASKDSNLFYKSDDKWHELKISPRQMVTIKYKGPKTMRFSRLKTNLPNPEKPEADENFTGAGSFEIPVPSGDIFALMIKSGNNARFYPMNISPKELPKNKFAVMNMTHQSVAFNINGQTSIIGPGRSFIFSPKKKDNAGITCQIAKRVKGKWIPCYKNIISLPDDAKTMLLVYDPANKSAPRFNVQVLNLR